MPDGIGDKRILRRFAALQDDRRHRVQLAQSRNVRVVILVARRAQHHEIATARALAHPLERFIQIVTSAHQPKPSLCFCLDIVGIPGAEILVGMICGVKRRIRRTVAIETTIERMNGGGLMTCPCSFDFRNQQSGHLRQGDSPVNSADQLPPN